MQHGPGKNFSELQPHYLQHKIQLRVDNFHCHEWAQNTSANSIRQFPNLKRKSVVCWQLHHHSVRKKVTIFMALLGFKNGKLKPVQHPSFSLLKQPEKRRYTPDTIQLVNHEISHIIICNYTVIHHGKILKSLCAHFISPL